MKRKLAASLLVMVAVFSAAAFAAEGTQIDRTAAAASGESGKGHWVFFVGKATPRLEDSSTDADCTPLRMSVKAYVTGNRARGSVNVGSKTYRMVARRDNKRIWRGVLYSDGKKVGAFKGKYLPNRKAFIGGMRLDGGTYKVELKRVYPARAEELPEGSE